MNDRVITRIKITILRFSKSNNVFYFLLWGEGGAGERNLCVALIHTLIPTHVPGLGASWTCSSQPSSCG